MIDVDALRVLIADTVRAVVREELRPVTSKIDDEDLSAEQAADLLHTTREALIKKAYRGSVKCRRYGREYRFRRGDLVG